MKAKFIFFSLLIVVAGFGSMQTSAQQDEDVRGSFLTTRPKASDKGTKPGPNTKPNRRRPKVAPSTTQGTTNSSAANAGSKNRSTTGATTPAKVNPQRLGLGLTLFMRDSNGLAVRTDPSHEFRKGDRVRFLLETNTDGYLYIFNTTDGGSPVMIYPDPELDEAGNYLQAHVPFEIPSSVAGEERLRWLAFDQNAGVEKLFFVFTREPLNSVPIEDDLISFCRENNGKCPWNPATEIWGQIQQGLSEPIEVAKVAGLGKAQTSTEHQAATRGIGLSRDDPEPSLIMLSASTSKNMLVTSLELIHKSASLAFETNEESQE